jgi:AcrR family transcriptional regulator
MDTDPRRSIGARRNPASAEAILEAAAAVLAEAGPSGFSIEAVAKRARAGKPTIYRWWPSRAALLLEVYQRQKGNVGKPDTGNLEEDLFRFLKGLLQLWQNTPSGPIFRSVIAEAQSDPDAAEALAAYNRERAAYNCVMVDRAKARGEVAEDAPSEAVVDMLASFAWTHLLTGNLALSDEEIRTAVQVLTRGIVTRAPAG